MVRRTHESRGARVAGRFDRSLIGGAPLGATHDVDELCDTVVAEARELTGAERVVLLLEGPGDLRLSKAMVPPTECEADLIEAICPWFEAARISRTVSLRHGPPGAPTAEQRSCIVAPLLSRGGLLGFLYVDVGGAVGRFDTTDRDRIAMLARRAALAIEDRRAIDVLKRDLAERTREAARSSSELALVSSIQGALAAARDMQAIYDAAGDKIREIFQLADVGIRVYDAQSGMMSFPYFYESGVRLAVDPVPWSDSHIASHVLRTRETVVINDFPNDGYRRFPSYILPGTRAEKSGLFVPLLLGDEFHGLIHVLDMEREHAFSADDVRLLEALARSMSAPLRSAGLFLETQRLLKETEQRNAELAVINSVQSALAAELSIQGIYDAVGDKIREIFHGLDVGIRIFDPATRTVSFPYTLERGARATIAPLPLTDESGGFGPHIFRTGETLLINRDMPGAMERFGSYVMPGTQAVEKSTLLVPMVGGGVVRGLIALADFEREDAFD